MKRYILIRLLKSILSICIVVGIVVLLVFKLVPVTKVFEKDEAYRKLKGNTKIAYSYAKLETQSYLDYLTEAEIIEKQELAVHSLAELSEADLDSVKTDLEDKGYVVRRYSGNDSLTGTYYAFRNYGTFELIGKFFGKLLVIDHPNKIQDPENPDMERGYRIEKDHNGVYALMCEGCIHKHQIFFDKRFPFIHSNVLSLNFGESYPTFQGVHTLDVISNRQGKTIRTEQTFPSGKEMKSPIDQHTLKYKYRLDHLDEKKYGDSHYADSRSVHEAPSMIGISYRMGILAVLIAYMVAVPAGVTMARRKGKFADKLGIVYINLIIALPSLALIFLVKYFGFQLGMPDKFPELGFFNIKSYILPVLCLALLSTPGLMMWIRRYMVDQENADYVKFAKAKGLSDKEISRRHVLKNAIVPIVNGIPGSIILAISGAVITETMFAVPGMGKMLPDAIKSANNNMVITLAFIFTSLSILSVFLGDILMTIIDPRISLNVKKGVD